ncbi:MAG TPA: hypothetical protein VMZ28_10045 [Kofleriaceae bacterium]|nr:hypothetical protein [Kofleriaceae bacterium]
MKTYRTLAGLAVAAAIVAGLVWWDRGRPGTDESGRARDRLAPAFDRARATTLEVRRGAVTTRLVHDGAVWWLASPHLRAEEQVVDPILGTLEYGRLERRVPHADAKLRAQAGVDTPRVVLTVGGTTWKLGTDDPSGRGVYLVRSDDPDLLVAEHRIVEVTDLPQDSFISHRLTLDSPDAASSIAIGPLLLERKNGWQVRRPYAARADDKTVSELIDALARARATRVLAAGPTVATVPLLLDGKPQSTLGGACPGSDELQVARQDGALLCFAASSLQPLRRPPEAFRELRVFPFALNDIVAVDLKDGPHELRLRREANVWRLVAPLAAAGPVSDAKVRAFLLPLLALRHPVAPSTTQARLATPDDSAASPIPQIPLSPAHFR